jgi:hypothetical protein
MNFMQTKKKVAVVSACVRSCVRTGFTHLKKKYRKPERRIKQDTGRVLLNNPKTKQNKTKMNNPVLHTTCSLGYQALVIVLQHSSMPKKVWWENIPTLDDNHSSCQDQMLLNVRQSLIQLKLQNLEKRHKRMLSPSEESSIHNQTMITMETEQDDFYDTEELDELEEKLNRLRFRNIVEQFQLTAIPVSTIV